MHRQNTSRFIIQSFMKEAQDKKEKLLVISQAADYLGVSIDTVRRWDRRGLLHAIRPNGKTRYFPLSELASAKDGLPRGSSRPIGMVRGKGAIWHIGLILVRLGVLLFILLTVLFLLVPNETAKILTTVFNTLR